MIKKIKNRIEKIKIISSIFISNFSLEAKLTTYTNNTISPPKKIKNKIKENHLVFIKVQIKRHIIKVWIKITIKIITGLEEIIIIILKNIDIKVNIIITEFSLFKTLTLEVKNNF